MRPSSNLPRRAVRALPWCLFLLLSSCSGGDQLHAAKGQVLYKGNPIKGAIVVFHPKAGDDLNAQRPSGVTGADGGFSLFTGSKEGAPAGDYVVTVTWLKEPEPAKAKGGIKNTSDDPGEAVDQLGGRYANRSASKIHATVKGGATQLDPFKLD